MARKQEGFTLVELLVTLILGTALIIAFFTLYRTGSAINTAATRQTIAKNFAYSELRKYSQAQPVSWGFSCTSATNKVTSGGQSITSTSPIPSGLPAPVVVTIRASAPYGCYAPNTDMPVAIEVTVQYGPSNQKVIYAAYTKT